MIFFIIIALIFFLIGITSGILCYFKREFIANHYYKIIPIICIGVWALYFLFSLGYFKTGYIGGDFKVFYMAGKQVLSDPEHLYDTPTPSPYVYLPSFALSFSITLSLLPFELAYFIFYFINFLSGILSVFEFNKILKMMNIKKKKVRFIFLLLISNGYFIYTQFKFNQFKYLVLIIFLFIIRREIQYRIEKKMKDFKFNLINYVLFIYAIGVTAYFIFPLLIYVFHDVIFKEIFSKENIRRYFLVILLFILENFLFVIFPNLIFEFIKSVYHPTKGRSLIRMLYLKDLVDVSKSEMRIIIYIFNTILAIFTVILIYFKDLTIEKKFSYYMLAHLFFGVYSFQFLLCLVLFPFIILLFIPFLKQNERGLEFIKSNIVLLIGILAVGIIYFVSDDFIFVEFLPNYNEFFYGIIWDAKLLILHIIMLISLSILYIQSYKNAKSKKEIELQRTKSKEIT